MSDSILSRLRIKAFWGVAAFVGAYLVPYLTVAQNPTPVFESIRIGSRYNDPEPLTEILGSGVAEWKVAGMFHFGGQLVNTVILLPSGLHEPINPVLDAGGIYLLFLLVPPAALILGGMLATRKVKDPHDFTYDFGAGTWQRYAINAGVEMMLGYGGTALVVMLAHFYFPQPNVITGWFLAAMIYPLVFGGLGGALAYRLTDDYETGKKDAHYTLTEMEEAN